LFAAAGIASIALLDGKIDRAIGGLLNDEDHEEIRGDYSETRKRISE